MNTLYALVALALVSCAAPSGPRPGSVVALLADEPARPYKEIARLEVRGNPGEHVRYVYDELRERAAALGADAVVKTAERALLDATPAPYDPPDRPLLGNAYPGPLRSLEPGAFPAEGARVKARGRYYEVEGIAIRYVD